MAAQGVHRPTLPEPTPRYDERVMRRTVRLIEQFMLGVHGRFLNDQTVVVEEWQGAAIVIDDDSNDTPVTTSHSLRTQAKNGVYFIDATMVFDPGSSVRYATVEVEIDPDGASGFSTAATYSWPVEYVQSQPINLTFTSTSLVAGGTIRLRGTGTDSEAGDWSVTITPLRVRGQ